MKNYAKKLSKSAFALAIGLACATAFTACHQVGDAVNGATQKMKTPKTVTRASKPVVVPTVAALQEYDWVLVNAQRQGADIHQFSKVIKQKKAMMRFHTDYVAYGVGCNHISGSYRLEDGFFSVDAPMSTMMACHDAQAAEMQLNDWMKSDSGLAIDIDEANQTAILTQTQGADVLTWQGKKTYEARYGEPARLFWEIDSKKQACVDHAGQDSQCLKVRNVNYNEQGIKTGSGAWRTFHGQIEGYKHDESLRQIIRLKAYNNPKDNKEPIYVFDMAVETEFLQR